MMGCPSEMAKDKGARALQKRTGLPYTTALEWRREHHKEIREYAHEQDMTYITAMHAVYTAEAEVLAEEEE